MNLEEIVSRTNKSIFFKEFTFSKNNFYPKPSGELEFADNVVWLDNIFLVYQVKERDSKSVKDKVSEENWFNSKVLKKAKNQIKDTLNYLESYEEINVINERGHTFNIAAGTKQYIKKIILYSASEYLPTNLRLLKSYMSKKVGLVHLLAIDDYVGILETLITPMEIEEYFRFREEIISKWTLEINKLPEQALVGYYLSGETQNPITIEYMKYLNNLVMNPDEFDFSGIIEKLPFRVESTENPEDYYKIIKEIAKLKRSGLKVFKEKFEWGLKRAKDNDVFQPSRMADPKTNCGFIFIPLPNEAVDKWKNAITNFTMANKYDLKLFKCIGITFAIDPNNKSIYQIHWSLIEHEWVFNSELENKIKKLLRPVQAKKINNYNFG